MQNSEDLYASGGLFFKQNSGEIGSLPMKYALHFIGQAFHPGTIVPTYGAGRVGSEIEKKDPLWMDTSLECIFLD